VKWRSLEISYRYSRIAAIRMLENKTARLPVTFVPDAVTVPVPVGMVAGVVSFPATEVVMTSRLEAVGSAGMSLESVGSVGATLEVVGSVRMTELVWVPSIPVVVMVAVPTGVPSE